MEKEARSSSFPLSDEAKNAVQKYLSERKDMSDALFIEIKDKKRKAQKMDTNPSLSRSVERIVKAHAIKAGISKR